MFTSPKCVILSRKKGGRCPGTDCGALRRTHDYRARQSHGLPCAWRAQGPEAVFPRRSRARTQGTVVEGVGGQRLDENRIAFSEDEGRAARFQHRSVGAPEPCRQRPGRTGSVAPCLVDFHPHSAVVRVSRVQGRGTRRKRARIHGENPLAIFLRPGSGGVPAERDEQITLRALSRSAEEDAVAGEVEGPAGHLGAAPVAVPMRRGPR